MSCGRKLGPYDCCSVVCGDCLEAMKAIPGGCVDAVVTDPPYGLTQNAWDRQIDLAAWWAIVGRLSSGAVVLCASQPFSSIAVCSNLMEFRHEWIWRKNRGSNFANTVREPFKEHEHILVFSRGAWIYHGQRESRRGAGSERANYKVGWNPGGSNYREFAPRDPVEITKDRVPSSVQEWNTEVGLHPTQKPEKMMAYLCATYTDEESTILDPFIGSGTTAVAAKKLGRHYLGFEISEEYCRIARERLALVEAQPSLFDRTEKMRQECLAYDGEDKDGALRGELDCLVEMQMLKERKE